MEINNQFQAMLERLCNDYDEDAGRYPESAYEGKSLYEYYMRNCWRYVIAE